MNIGRRKMANMIMSYQEGRKRMLNLCSILLFQVVLVQISQVNASFYSMNDEPGYDPELNSEGVIPELSHKRLTPAAAAVKWNYDDHHDEDTHDVLPAKAVQPRSDMEVDEDEDDDRDEDKSGTSAHGSYTESPAYGESPRAARDGEDIESFFDTHLGPHEAAESTQADADSSPGSSTAESQQVDPDDDQYETAASSPLSNIFHTIIRAHRRPVIITTSDDSSPPTSKTTEGATSAAASTSVESSQSASSLVGSTSSPIAGISFVRGSPFLDIPQLAQGTYFSPITASASSYEPQGEQDSSSQEGHEEIYIARRPSFLPLARFRDYAIPLEREKLMQQSSNANWRGYSATSRPSYEQQQQSNGYQGRYLFSPSYVYQSAPRLLPVPSHLHQQQPQAPAPEEEQTVSYGLSFGGSSSLPLAVGSDEGSSSEGSSSIGDKSSIHDEPLASHYSSDNPSAYPYKPFVRPNFSATQTYNNYNHPLPFMGQLAAAGPTAPYSSNQAIQTMGPPRSAYQQHQIGSARAFTGATGQAQQTLNYNQYSGSNPLAPTRTEGTKWSTTRHKLLASLDKQIKNNPFYQENAASSPDSQYILTSRHQMNRHEVPKQSKSLLLHKQQEEPVDPDVYTYSSFHHEMDPFKTFTSASELVNEPQFDNSERKNNHQTPANTNSDEASTSETRPNKSYHSINSKENNQYQNLTPQPNQPTASKTLSGTNETSTTTTRLSGKNRVPHLSRYDSLRVTNDTLNSADSIHNQGSVKYRVRREDSDDRENDDAEDDGVWVDDDEDDDNRQSATDLTETTEEPIDEEPNQVENNQNSDYQPLHNHVTYTPGVLGNPHGYELSPY